MTQSKRLEMRMAPGYLAQLDIIVKKYGLCSRSEGVRWLVSLECAKIMNGGHTPGGCHE